MENTLIELFIHICNTGYQASAIILVLLVIRFFFDKAGVPKKVSCLLWSIPFLRLAIPVKLKSTISLLPVRTAPIPKNLTSMEQPVIYRSTGEVNTVVSRSLDRALIAAGTDARDIFLQEFLLLFAALWLFGCIVLLLHGIIAANTLRRRLRTAVRVGNEIYLADKIPTAFVFGLWKPGIYLPSDVEPEYFEYLIAHEQAHIKRRDYLSKALAYALVLLYWFHPVIWIAYRLLGRDIEYACDEAVIRQKDAGYKKAYAAALLAVSAGKFHRLWLPVSFSKDSPKKRIWRIVKYQNPMKATVALAVVCCIVLGGVFLTDPKEPGLASNKENEMEQTENVVPGKSGKEAQEAQIEIAVPVVDLTGSTGATGTQLLYADEEMLVVSGYYGLFVYSKTEHRMIRGVDLAAIGCEAIQGDTYCEQRVSNDGSTVYLHRIDAIHPEETVLYAYNIQENSLKKMPDSAMPKMLHAQADSGGSDSIIQSMEWTDEEGTVWHTYLTDRWSIGSVSWKDSNYREGISAKELKETPPYPLFVPDDLAGARPFLGKDIHDLTDIDFLVEGRRYHTSDPDVLLAAEGMLSQVKGEVVGGSGCPFYNPMYLTRADGTVGVIFPATDGCAIYEAQYGWYEYKAGAGNGNEAFWALFDGWDELANNQWSRK